ncbi:MAG: Na(+)-translocating NADH-quinone reductase subunit A [Candidatus Hydrogenedentes bacterium]|nr:Na(+)-translocating NADH-quinone reductase subunit A [Candidatus Hydrogenedentota bacterium]
MHTFKKGMNLPISGEPEQAIHPASFPTHVALIAADHHGMKPSFRVRAGDSVKRGQILFEDKKTPGVYFTAPGAGTVSAINRGERRAFQSAVIALSPGERSGAPAADEFQTFENYTGKDPETLKRDQVAGLLIESGLWTALRTRPFSRTPQIDAIPSSIFVTAVDTHPLAPNMDVVAAGREADMGAGLVVLSKLVPKVYFCKAKGSRLQASAASGAINEEFAGPHPSGTVGLHIHTLDPVSAKKSVWHVGLQDVLAIGRLFRTGQLDVDRVVALGGPSALKPRLLRTRLGVALGTLTDGELKEGENRIVSGSVLAGRASQGEAHGYLGRFHQQITVLREGREREFLGWLSLGAEKFSLLNIYISKFNPEKKFNFTTTTNGSHRAMVPIGLYEKVMPMDILPTYLLRSLAVGDLERAEELGCLELDEEDLGLCSFVCPGKSDYGTILRYNLTTIEKEG